MAACLSLFSFVAVDAQHWGMRSQNSVFNHLCSAMEGKDNSPGFLHVVFNVLAGNMITQVALWHAAAVDSLVCTEPAEHSPATLGARVQRSSA